jgi:hypothetical protein
MDSLALPEGKYPLDAQKFSYSNIPCSEGNRHEGSGESKARVLHSSAKSKISLKGHLWRIRRYMW